jgi:hypothetical protein
MGHFINNSQGDKTAEWMMQSQWKLFQLQSKTWGSSTCVPYFLVYAVLNWRVLDMAYAGASGTVTVDDQRSYVLHQDWNFTWQKKPTEIHITLREVCAEQTVGRSSFPLGYSFSWRKWHHKRWPKARKAENINRWKKCETCNWLSCRWSSSDVWGNITRYRDFTHISIPYFDKWFAEKKKIVPDGSLTAWLMNRNRNAWKFQHY